MHRAPARARRRPRGKGFVRPRFGQTNSSSKTDSATLKEDNTSLEARSTVVVDRAAVAQKNATLKRDNAESTQENATPKEVNTEMVQESATLTENAARGKYRSLLLESRRLTCWSSTSMPRRRLLLTTRSTASLPRGSTSSQDGRPGCQARRRLSRSPSPPLPTRPPPRPRRTPSAPTSTLKKVEHIWKRREAYSADDSARTH